MTTRRASARRPRGAATLWAQHVPPDRRALELMVGDDRDVDAALLAWDILGSLGHVEGLRASRLLSADEHAALRAGLREALAAARAGRFSIGPEHEDAHSAVEDRLTRRTGRAGAKLHTGRSRNDQIACTLRLWLKRSLLTVHDEAGALASELLRFARRHRNVRFPGYTHTRKAMPSSMALWAAGHAAGLIDTLETFPALWTGVDRSPLGSAAGYGVPLPLDRNAAARALGFREVEQPVTAVQNGRGKLEAAALFWCAQLGHDAAKAASDVILFAAEEYGYLAIDPALATGSSLMPHKRNPDLFELARARAAALEGDLAAILALRARLSSGYHRDFQLMKAPLLRGIGCGAEMLEMLRIGIRGLAPDRARCAKALEGGVLATGEALALARRGVPFRDAYRAVSASIAKGAKPGRLDAIAGTLDVRILERLSRRVTAARRFARAQERSLERALARLAGRSA